MLFLCSVQFSFAEDGSGTLTGRWITKEYGPMTGGQVLLFNKAKGPPPASHRYLRLPDHGTAIDEEGRFSLDVPAGRYYLVMRKREDPAAAGPPREGEPQYYARDRKGKPMEYVVKAGRTTNVGTITSFVPYRRPATPPVDGTTGIEGRVIDGKGEPVAGIRVFAYETAEMKGMPRNASGATGADGKYLLVLTGKGAYFLKARTHYGGGQPEEGELMGVYGTSEKPESVAVEEGKIRGGVDIRVQRISRQPGQQRVKP